MYYNTRVLVCINILDQNFRRNSDFRFAKFVVDVDLGHCRRHDNWTPCSVARRRDSRRFGTMPLLVLVGLLPCCGQEVSKMRFPSAGRLRPTFSFFLICCDAQVWALTCISGSSSTRDSDFLLAQLVQDVDMGYSQNNDYEGA